jgi:outer membrane lipoprotein-sorting protein
MKTRFAKLFIPFLFIPIFFLTVFIPESYGKSNSIINKIEARYRTVHSISAYFEQKEIIPGYSQNMAFKGYFYYERNNYGKAGGMAWIYEYPFHKRQVLKNGKLYIVNNQIKKVSIINVGKERGGFPPNVVEVIGNLTKYFKVRHISANSGSGIITIELKPIAMQIAKTIYVGFYKNGFKIESLKIITHQGQIIIFNYKDVKFNGHINVSVFNLNFRSDYKIVKEN